MYKKFSDGQLGKALDDPEAQREKQRRDALRASMANGGIIAFKDGESVEDENKRRVIKGEKRDDIKRLQAGATSEESFDSDMLNRMEADKREERINRDLNPPVAAAPVNNEAIIAAAGKNVSPIPKAPAAPASNSQGITAAPTAKGKAALYGNEAYGDYTEGQEGIKTLDSNEQADAELNKVIGTMDAKRLALEEIANKPSADLVTGYQKDRESIGLSDPAQKQRERREERKTRGEADEVQAARNNLIQFLTKWGTTPGSALRGFTAAGVDLVEKMDLDRKTRQRFLNEIDEIDSQIDSAEYARRLGDENRAQAEKKAAGENAWKLQHDIAKMRLDVALKNKDVQKVLEQARIKAENQHLKGDDNGIEITYQGLIALPGEKYPPGPVTRMIAAQAWQKSKPSTNKRTCNQQHILNIF
jgi:hypothetical protein